MTTMITNECINCGACEAECPNTALARPRRCQRHRRIQPVRHRRR